MKKCVFLVLIFLFFVLQARLFGKTDGFRDVIRLKQTIALQSEELGRLKQRNEALDSEVQALKNFPDSIEERARAELGMIKEGETFCVVVDK